MRKTIRAALVIGAAVAATLTVASTSASAAPATNNGTYIHYSVSSSGTFEHGN